MSTDVKARIVKIGHSRGIRIPRLLLEQSRLGGISSWRWKKITS
jgi:hypothetical protein